MPKEIIEIKKLSLDELREIATILVRATEVEIKRIIADKTEPHINRIIAGALEDARVGNNWSKLDSILDRVVGKAREVIDINIQRPSILVMRDGREVHFTQKKIAPGDSEDEDDGEA